MTLRLFAALAALSAAIVVAGWGVMSLAGLGSSQPDAAVVDSADATPVAAADTQAEPTPAGTTEDTYLVPDAAIIDSALFDPHPMMGGRDSPVQVAAASAPDAVQNYATDDAVGAVRGSPEIAAVRKAIAVAKIDKENGLTLAHIAQIKAGLNLTREQRRYWPPVEAELKEIARQVMAQKESGKKLTIAADQAQRLYFAAGPLIMSLSEAQKQEIRRAARAMGLTEVASLI